VVEALEASLPYYVEVRADSTPESDPRAWCGNSLRFATQAEAEAYAIDLAWRWTSVRAWRVVREGSAEPVAQS
jgi:hypothetical protein